MVSINGADYEECANGMLLGSGGKSAAGWHDIESFIRCPKEFQYRNARGITVPAVQTPDALSIGSMLHAGRARWFGNDFDTSAASWAAIRVTVESEAEHADLPVSTAAIQQALTLLEGYVGHYCKMPRPKPLACEYLLGPAGLGLGHRPETWRTARLDDVGYYPEAGGLAIGEVKTTSGRLSDVFKKYEYHGQTMMQQLLWRHDPEGEARWGKLKGTVLDGICKRGKSGKPEYARYFIPFTDWQLDEFARTMQFYFVDKEASEDSGYYQRNPTACVRPGAFGPTLCPYLELCKRGRDAANEFVFRDGSSLRSWKPKPGDEIPPWS